MIMNRLELREWDPVLNKGALWTYWEGAYRDTGRDEGATLVMQTQGKQGWFWYIPLHDNIVSVGVVAPFDYLFKNRPDKDHEAIYFEEVGRVPRRARRGSPGPSAWRRSAPPRTIRTARGRRPATAGCWSATPSASSIRSIPPACCWRLKSGQLAADAIAEGLAKGDTSAAQLGKWEPTSSAAWTACAGWCANTTTASASAGSSKHPHLKGFVTDLLIGDLFKDNVDAVWGPLDAMRAESVRKK